MACFFVPFLVTGQLAAHLARVRDLWRAWEARCGQPVPELAVVGQLNRALREYRTQPDPGTPPARLAGWWRLVRRHMAEAPPDGWAGCGVSHAARAGLDKEADDANHPASN